MHSVFENKIFRFENFWREYHSCHDSVARVWRFAPRTSPMHAFSHLISRTKSQLISWRASGYSSLDTDIQNTERDIAFLENLESSSCPNSIDSMCLRALNNKYAALLKQSNIHWAQ